MSLVPRITKSDNSIVKQMYKDWYILRAVTPEFMYWDKNDEIKKKIKKTDLIVSNEYQLSISYLKNINIDTLHNSDPPDYAMEYKKYWIEFVLYWTEKANNWKIRAEWQKTFEIKRRFYTWLKVAKVNYEKNTSSALDITL